jgi:hypothetical protein
MHQSFLSIARYRYAVYGILLCVGSAACYLVDSWRERPNGGTVLGYTLGGIAAALVLFLMSYGIRRRSFKGGAGSTKRWLSMHVYFGLSVLIIATLHSGLQFGYNAHTICFGLLCLVVLSGCWGVYAYVRYPALMSRERGELGRDELLARLGEVDREALNCSASLEPEVSDLVADAVLRTRIGGDIWAQLRGRDQSMLLLSPVRERGFSRMVSNRGQGALIAQLARFHATSQDAQAQQTLHRLLQISGDKAVLLRRLQRDIQLQGLLQAWLYLHLPLSFAMLAALVVHVFSVFYYW